MALFTPSILQSAVLDALGNFLLAILPDFTPSQIVIGQENRLSEAEASDFIVMTPLFRDRLTLDNITTYAPSSFTGSIAGGVLTVSAVTLGSVTPGNMLFGTGLAANTIVGAQQSGPSGGVGTYAVTPAQTLGSTLLACGSKTALQPVDITIQLDIHGPGSFDNSGVVQTMFRDEYAITLFSPWSSGISPLYCEDAIEMTFVNDQTQVEQRWVLSAHLHVNTSIVIPAQFASTVKVTTIAIGAA